MFALEWQKGKGEAKGKRHVCCYAGDLPCCPNAFKQQVACQDTDDGALDNGWYGCSSYDEDPSYCNNYDDTDFSSGDMCCACQEASGNDYLISSLRLTPAFGYIAASVAQRRFCKIPEGSRRCVGATEVKRSAPHQETAFRFGSRRARESPGPNRVPRGLQSGPDPRRPKQAR